MSNTSILLKLLIVFIAINVSKKGYSQINISRDTNYIIKLNNQAFSSLLTSAEKTITIANKALSEARRLNYETGTANSLLIRGNGYSYLGNSRDAINDYLTCLKIFQKNHDLLNQLKTYAGIINLYKNNSYDQEQALRYIKIAKTIAQKLPNNRTSATINLSEANIYYRQKRYMEARYCYTASQKLFSSLKDSLNTIQCTLGIGNVYYSLGNYYGAKDILIDIKDESEKKNYYMLIAPIDLTLANIYIYTKEFAIAQKLIDEGLLYSRDKQTEHDFYYLKYRIEFISKNYEKALMYLKNIYQSDSLDARDYMSAQVRIQSQIFQQLDHRHQIQIAEEQRKYDRIRFWALIMIILSLLLIVTILIANVRRKSKTTIALNNLNREVSEQKNDLDRINRHLEEIVDERTNQLEQSLKRSDALLRNILPADVAEELKEKGSTDARMFDEVSVLFTDFVNFTIISEMLTPKQLVDELHYCFKAFDEIIVKHRIEKIKTIGDAYLAVAGLPNADTNHATNAINAAIEITSFVRERKAEKGDKTFDIRVGIHSGSVVAGIVGVKKFAYDIWGDTVNTAARMEQNSEPGRINISEKTHELVKDDYAFTYRGEIPAKNKGMLKMYFVEAVWQRHYTPFNVN